MSFRKKESYYVIPHITVNFNSFAMLHQFIFRRPNFGGTDSNRKQLFRRNGISQLVKSHNYICDLHRGVTFYLSCYFFSHPIQLDCLKCMDTDVSISFLPFPVFPSNRTWKHHICLLYPPTEIMEDFRLFPPSNHLSLSL